MRGCAARRHRRLIRVYEPFEAINGDRNGRIDVGQPKGTAERLFEQLNHRGAGRLSGAELGRGRLTVAQFSWADRDHGGTLTKDEYLALVDREFRAADLDYDGTVSRIEFRFESWAAAAALGVLEGEPVCAAGVEGLPSDPNHPFQPCALI